MPDLLERLGPLGEFDRTQHIGGLVDEIARQHDAVADRLLPLEGFLGLLGIGAMHNQLLQAVVLGLFVVVLVLLRQVLFELVAAQIGPQRHRRSNLVLGELRFTRHLDHQAGRLRLVRIEFGESRPTRHHPVVLFGLFGVAAADQNHPRRILSPAGARISADDFALPLKSAAFAARLKMPSPALSMAFARGSKLRPVADKQANDPLGAVLE